MASSRFEKTVSVAKDLVVLLRDLSIIVFAVLLLAFPIRFNSILVEAGFEEGSIVGFKWKSKLVESNEALEQANVSIGELKKENSDLIDALTNAKSRIEDPELSQEFSDLESENVKLSRKTDEVQTIVRDAIESNEPLVAKVVMSSENDSYDLSDYTVGLQTVGISNDTREMLNKEIREFGYSLDSVTYSYDENRRPGWFALEPTVFYYSNSSKSEATNLASLMKQQTGKEFEIRRGAGLGVNPAKKHLTFFIHYL